MAEFRLLGPVEVRANGRPVDAGTAKQRSVLAALLLDLNRPVTVETLVSRVWDTDPPAEARNVLYAHLSRIRRLLRELPADIERRSGGGYVLVADPDLVDLHRMRRLADQATAGGGTDEERSTLLLAAVDLRHGEPLDGLPGEWLARARESIRQQWLDVALQWARLELRLGRPGTAIERLRPLAAEYPHVEPVTIELMRALHADGRTAEALDCFAATRRRLADELGVDPGADLRKVHQDLLRGGSVPTPQPQPATAVPALLPMGVGGFAGREDELRRLDRLLDADEPSTVVITAVSGTAGVGKTALAVHWAHRVADRFPDGQLYVNLRGFDPSGPVSPGEALRGFLDALDVPTRRVPEGLAEQVNLYRSRLAGRRVLIVLDNAGDAEQVRPLLPGAPGCVVVVTSRNQLTGLVAAAGARPLTLDLLPTDDARDLLARRLGHDRVAAEPDAVDEIIARCARLPLALAIVAARAATHTDFTLKALAGELREAGEPLAPFATEDAATDVRAVFSWSYQRISPAAGRLFRRFGLHPGPDITTEAAASLAGLPLEETRPLLDELAANHLVREHAPGRYSLHDLLRGYAIELAGRDGEGADRTAALRRLVDHHLFTAATASAELEPIRSPHPPWPDRVDGVSVTPIADRAEASEWFVAERLNLLAIIELTAREGLDVHTFQLAWTTQSALDRQGRWHDWIHTQRISLAGATRLGNERMRAHNQRTLGRAYSKVGRMDEAETYLRRAYDTFAALEFNTGQAHTLLDLAAVYDHRGRPAEALDCVRATIALYEAAGDVYGLGNAHNGIGWYLAMSGEYPEALRECEQALELLQEIDDRYGLAATWDSLGYIHHHLGDHARAEECYREALELYRDFGDQPNEAAVFYHLGDNLRDAGDHDGARAAWRRALDILGPLDHPDAARLRDLLA